MTRAIRFIGFERTVSDLEASIGFYCEALGFEVDTRIASEARLLLGRESIRLIQGAVPQPKPGVGFHHFAIVTNDMQAAFERLVGFGVTAISKGGYRQLPPSSGGVQAFKFRDPDGHPLELIAFPRASDDDAHLRWTEMGTDRLTLGIDHSAIVVSDADRSIAFYEKALGLKLTSRQTNRGDEQALLDGVDRASVDVVGLSPASKDSPHLELLCYATPANLGVASAIEVDLADRMIFLVDLIERVEPIARVDHDTSRTICDPDGYPLKLTTDQEERLEVL